MRTLALIPARAGSKGIPHKNTRLFKGEPLVAHAIKIGLRCCNAALVTTDDPNVAAIARSYGADVLLRPAELAQDDTPMLPVVQHALGACREKPDVIVLLQPTSPLRTVVHVNAALMLLESSGADSVASVVAVPAIMHPGQAMLLPVLIHGGPQLQPWDQRGHLSASMDGLPTRRQEGAPSYYRDGTVYVARAATIEARSLYGRYCAPLIIPAAESATIDTEDDWQAAEAKHG